MLSIAAYVVAIASITACLVFIKKNWKTIVVSKIDVQATILNNSVQIIILSLGSVIAVYTLNTAVLDYEREQNARTSELLSEHPYEQLENASTKYRYFTIALFKRGPGTSFSTEQRKEIIEDLFRNGIETTYSDLEKALNKLLVCGETGECNKRRINATVCWLTDDFAGVSELKLQVDSLEDKIVRFAYFSGEEMSNFERRSCGTAYWLIDYISAQ
jgi:hypothetical protein